MLGAIGDTPLVAMTRSLREAPVQVWAQLEATNPGGSAKDRPAARMVADALGGAGYLRTVYDDDRVARTLGCSPVELVALAELVAPSPPQPVPAAV